MPWGTVVLLIPLPLLVGGAFNPSTRLEARIVLGCEKGGVQLDLVNIERSVLPAEPHQRIVVSSDGQQQIERLDQLRGKVRIADRRSALRLVRLRTSPATWFAWPGQRFEVEIVPLESVQSLPNYGLQSYRQLSRVASGYMGILAAKKFHDAGFEPPRITRVTDGFEITRWILMRDFVRKQMRVQKIRENVGYEGGYRREILETREPPKLRGTLWYLPSFE